MLRADNLRSIDPERLVRSPLPAADLAARRVMAIEALSGAAPKDQVMLVLDALGQISDPKARVAVLRAVSNATWDDVKDGNNG